MKRVRYPAEFKAEALKQVTERGHGVVDVAKRLGMSVNYPLVGSGLSKRGLDQGLGHHRQRAQWP